ncbi:hypothetical protein [Burkholderia sp. IDO3]|uniref:hypothetical protein n=1 Tax=Burkholderia sp. IDO3 TaxID=1705310 RepID=UPI0013B471D1|nr:hypothetical protein [Burkholderia sp. IDO3]
MLTGFGVFAMLGVDAATRGSLSVGTGLLVLLATIYRRSRRPQAAAHATCVALGAERA